MHTLLSFPDKAFFFFFYGEYSTSVRFFFLTALPGMSANVPWQLPGGCV